MVLVNGLHLLQGPGKTVHGHPLAGMAATPAANSSHIGEELPQAAVLEDVAFAMKKDTTDGAAHKGPRSMQGKLEACEHEPLRAH